MYTTKRSLDYFLNDLSKIFESELKTVKDSDFYKTVKKEYDSVLKNYSLTTFKKTIDDKEVGIVELVCPGVKKSELGIEIEGDYLYIKSANECFSIDKKIHIDPSYDKSNISAIHEDGILTITFYKLKKEEPKRTSIKIS